MSKINYIKIDPKIPDLKTAYFADTGYDLRAYSPFEDIILKPFEHKKIRTGIMMDIPLGIDAQIRPRSGLAEKFAVTVLNSPGTIDAGYKGEIQILLINFGKKPFIIKNSDKIAQICFTRRKTTELISCAPTEDELKNNKINHKKSEKPNLTEQNETINEKEQQKIYRENKNFGSSD